MSEDITYCTNKECSLKKCMRNPKNIKHHEIPHSFADLENKKGYCLKVIKKEKKNNAN